MKKMLLALYLIACAWNAGCQSCAKEMRHMQSSFIGLPREITLFDCSGKPIQTWETTSLVEIGGSTASWIGDDNKEIKISGTFIVRQK